MSKNITRDELAEGLIDLALRFANAAVETGGTLAPAQAEAAAQCVLAAKALDPDVMTKKEHNPSRNAQINPEWNPGMGH